MGTRAVVVSFLVTVATTLVLTFLGDWVFARIGPALKEGVRKAYHRDVLNWPRPKD